MHLEKERKNMETKHLEALSQLHGVSGDEMQVANYLIDNFSKEKFTLKADKLGSIIANQNKGTKTVSVVAHMDEVGMIVSYIDASGLLYFNPIGSWFSQSMLNHRVMIKTNTNEIIPGLIGSASPHALRDGMDTRFRIDEMFIDIGCDSKAEVEALGIELGNFVAPVGEYTKMGNKIVSKALDNRVACALLLDLSKQVINEQLNLNYVATVQEEVGLRGAQTSSTMLESDVAIILDVTICGDTPNVESKKFQTNMNQGPSICLFDKRTIPNQKLVSYVKEVATKYNVPIQYYTLQTGATDGGRYNVMAGGSAVISIGVPSRYIHANNSMISEQDYNDTLTLVTHLLNDLTPERIAEFLSFGIK